MGLFGAIIGSAIETAKLPVALDPTPARSHKSETLKTLDKIKEEAKDD